MTKNQSPQTDKGRNHREDKSASVMISNSPEDTFNQSTKLKILGAKILNENTQEFFAELLEKGVDAIPEGNQSHQSQSGSETEDTFNLSNLIFNKDVVDNLDYAFLMVSDVKEFIKRVKEAIKKSSETSFRFKDRFRVFGIIDKLAGEELS